MIRSNQAEPAFEIGFNYLQRHDVDILGNRRLRGNLYIVGAESGKNLSPVNGVFLLPHLNPFSLHQGVELFRLITHVFVQVPINRLNQN